MSARKPAGWVATAAVLALTTALLLRWRAELDKVHVALAYLLVVLGASAVGGRTLGLVTAGASFVLFNYVFLPPYYTLVINDPLDWGVLVAFLVTGVVAAQLLARAQEEAARARRHAEEVVRLTAEAERAKALVEADRLKDVLLATVSHDLRTPLTTIRALAQQISVDGDERALAIAEEVDRLNRQVADLLDLSQLRAGALVVRPVINAAEDLLGVALQRVGGLAQGRELRASLDPGEPVLLGRFDFTHALRALVNLLENALKYTPADAPVECAVRRDGTMLRFDVSDRGPGIPEQERARMFEPFLRGSGARQVGGTGLGLAIARGLIEAQGGRLMYHPRDGGGSVFSLLLPAADVRELEFAGPR